MFMDFDEPWREQRSLGRIFCALGAFMAACAAGAAGGYLAMPGRFGPGVICLSAAMAVGSLAASCAARLAWMFGRDGSRGWRAARLAGFLAALAAASGIGWLAGWRSLAPLMVVIAAGACGCLAHLVAVVLSWRREPARRRPAGHAMGGRGKDGSPGFG